MPQEGRKDRTLYCSFCGKSQHEVKKLIAGPTVFICDECVVLCLGVILDSGYTVEDIKLHLDLSEQDEMRNETHEKVLELLKTEISDRVPYIELNEALRKYEKAVKPSADPPPPSFPGIGETS